MDYNQAVKALENGNIDDCINYFKKNNYMLEYAYTLLLSGNLDSADREFRKLNSHRADWAVKIIPFLQGIVSTVPTYFQIRCFLEIDLTLLIKAKQIEYVQYLLGGASFFQNVNNETYKFIGRGLLKNGFMDSSKMFLDKALSEYYKDVELHYLFVEYYTANGDYINAKRAVENCLRIDPHYYPAVKYYSEHFGLSSLPQS